MKRPQQHATKTAEQEDTVMAEPAAAVAPSAKRSKKAAAAASAEKSAKPKAPKTQAPKKQAATPSQPQASRKRPTEQQQSAEEPQAKRKRPAAKQAPSGKPQKQQQQQPSGPADQDYSDGLASGIKLPSKIAPLSKTSVKPKDRFLGFVAKINERKSEAVIGLPYGLSAAVVLTEISDEAAAAVSAVAEGAEGAEMPKVGSYLRVGDLVSLSILPSTASTPNKRHLATLRPAAVNAGVDGDSLAAGQFLWCSVRSVEDHGCVMSCGVDGANVFLPRSEYPLRGAPVVGQPLACAVTSVTARAVNVTAKTAAVASAEAREVPSRSALRPGLRVAATARRCCSRPGSRGIAYSFLDGFVGCACAPAHLGSDGAGGADAFAPKAEVLGKRVPARIVYAAAYEPKDHSMARYHLSRRGDILAARPTTFSDNTFEGERIEAAEVVAVAPEFGALLKMAEGQVAFLHAGTTESASSSAFATKYAVGAKVSVCLRFTSSFDGIAYAGAREMELDTHAPTIASLSVGQTVSGTIDKVTPSGVFVRLSTKLRAVCPLVHALDGKVPAREGKAAPKLIESKFRPGQRVSCRVVDVEPSLERITVTLKSDLVANEPAITSWEDCKEGTVADGVVVDSNPAGLIIAFFGRVTGFAPAGHLSQSGARIDNPGAMFPNGTLVKCRVLSYARKPGAAESAHPRLIVSLRLDAPADKKSPVAASASAAKSKDSLSLPRTEEEIDVGTVVRVQLRARAHEGGFVVELVGDVRGTAHLPTEHLTDHVAHATALYNALALSSEHEAVVVSSTRRGGRKPSSDDDDDSSDDEKAAAKGRETVFTTVSIKPALVAAAKATTKNPEVGELAVGFVRSVRPTGIVVQFAHGRTAFAPKKHLADTFVQSVEELFKVGQTVRARVLSLEQPEDASKRQRVACTVRPSETTPADDITSMWLTSLLSESAVIAPPKAKIDLSSYRVGAVVAARVAQSVKHGVALRFPSVKGASGLALKQHNEGFGEAKMGADVRAVVLDVDARAGAIDAALSPAFVAAVEKGVKSAPPKLGQELEATVLLVKEQYLVVRVSVRPAGAARIAVCAGGRGFNTQNVPLSSFSIGQSLRVAAGPITDGRMIVVLTPAKTQQADDSLLKLESADEAKVGDVLDGKVVKFLPKWTIVALGASVFGRLRTSEPPAWGSLVRVRVARVSADGDRKHIDLEAADSPVGSSLAGVVDEDAAMASLSVGDSVECTVQSASATAVWVRTTSGARGRVFITDASDDVEELRALAAGSLPERMAAPARLQATVIAVDAKRHSVDLSLVAPRGAPAVGDVVVGRIAKIAPKIGVNVQLGAHTYGQAFITDLDDRIRADPFDGIAEGQIVAAKVLSSSPRIDLSLRQSDLGDRFSAFRAAAPESDPEQAPVRALSELSAGQTLHCYVHLSKPTGVHVSLGRRLMARASPRSLCHSPVAPSAVAGLFPESSRVAVRVVSVNAAASRVNVSLLAEEPFAAVVGRPHSVVVLASGSDGAVVRVVGGRRTGFLPASEIKGNKKLAAGAKLVAILREVDDTRAHPGRFVAAPAKAKAANAGCSDSELDARVIAEGLVDRLEGAADAQRAEGEPDEEDPAWELVEPSSTEAQ
eukprot:m51a1_g13928 putative protein RRP5 homolog (1614) ;mRNA; r:833552-838740